MAGGQQSDVSAGTLDDLRFVPLRSRKTVTGTASFELTGQAFSGAQGVFLKSKTGTLAGSVASAFSGNVGAPIAPAANTNFVRVVDTATNSDGPDYTYCSYSLKMAWVNAGGDWLSASNVPQGGDPYGTMDFPAEAWSQDNPANIKTSTNIAALVNNWMTNGNRGMFFRQVSGSILYLNGKIHHWGAIPKLIAKTTTSGGAFIDCPLLCAIGLPQGQNGPTIPALNSDVWNPNGCIRFDISALSGTCSEAYFSATNVNNRGDLAQVHLHLLNPTEIITDPATRFASDIETGLTATVQENALATHPNVLTYFTPASDADFYAHYLVREPFHPHPSYSYSVWTDLGNMPFLKAYYDNGQAGSERLIDCYLPFQTKTVSPHSDDNVSWRRDYVENQSLGYDEMYHSWYIEFDPNWATAMNEPNGLKLSSFACVNDYATSGAPTVPEPLGDEMFEVMVNHGTKSIEHPGVFHGGFYIYDQDTPLSTPLRGRFEWWNKHRGLAFLAGNKYHVELYIKMNSIAGNGTANPDGILRLWVNEVRVHDRTNMRWRIKPHHQIKAQIIKSYHGGVGTSPLIPVYHGLGRFTNATTRIGRVRSISLPADVPAPGFFRQVGTNMPQDVAGSSWSNAMMSIFGGGDYVEGLGGEGKFFVLGGGEHGAGLHNDEGGVICWDVATRTWTWPNRGTQTHFTQAGDPPYSPTLSATDEWGYYTDGTAGTTHTYNAVQALPAGWHPSYPNGAGCLVGHYIGSANQIPSVSPGAPGPGAVNAYNLVSQFQGQQRLTGSASLPNNQRYYDWINGTGDPATRGVGNDGSGSGKDFRRKGWWSRAAKNDSPNGYVSFCDVASGVITNFAPNQPGPGAAGGYCQFHVFNDEGAADNDILVQLGGPNLGPSEAEGFDWVYVSKMPWVAGTGFVPVNLINNTGIPVSQKPFIGFTGMRWCSHPSVQAFLGLDGFYNGIRILKIKPPPVGQRFTGQWIFTAEVIQSADGTVIRNSPPGSTNNESSFINGLHGRVVYIPHLRCLGFPMSSDRKFVFVRSSEMN